MSKTCKQSVLITRGRNAGRLGYRYLPHVVPDSVASGYATCESCGREVYVGRGCGSHEALQLAVGDPAAYHRIYGGRS